MYYIYCYKNKLNGHNNNGESHYDSNLTYPLR